MHHFCIIKKAFLEKSLQALTTGMKPEPFLKCNSNHIISSTICSIFDREGNTWSWRLLKQSGLSSNAVLYQCAYLITMEVKRSARPFLPISLIEINTATMTNDRMYLDRCFEPLS
jgi:hypothetical protein